MTWKQILCCLKDLLPMEAARTVRIESNSPILPAAFALHWESIKLVNLTMANLGLPISCMGLIEQIAMRLPGLSFYMLILAYPITRRPRARSVVAGDAPLSHLVF